MSKQSFFENPLLKTRIKTAEVKPKEMIIGYFLAPFCALISNAIFASYLNRYYSDVIGWTDTGRFGNFSALLPMISVIFVVIGNLFVGHLMDNTRTSQGKARPYLLLSAPLVTLAIALLFMTPIDMSPTVQMIWIALSYNIYYSIAYPFYYTSHSSMVALSTRDSDKRGLLATFSNASGVAAVGFGASIVIPILLQSYLFVEENGVINQALSYQNWRNIMVILCLITALAILLEYFFTRERITEENIKLNIVEKKLPMKQQVAACVKEKYWWFIILYFLLFQFGGLVKNGSMNYYCRWMFDGITTESAAGTAMGVLGAIGGIPTAIGMLLAWPIANKLGKQRAVTYGLALSVIGGLASFINVNNFVIVCIGVVLKGIGSIPAMYVTLALLSDVLDHLEAKNGFRSDGFTMSVYGAIMVGMTGLGNGIINALLSASGYDAMATVQNDSVKAMLVICYLGVELVCYAVLVVLTSFLKVEKHIEEDHKIIRENQKKAVLAEGREWVDPDNQL
jgi:GPH family glycoside/pentoside/hexuronide:cation symporter